MTPTARMGVFVAAALAAGFLGGWLLRGTPPQTAGQGASNDAQVEELLERMERLEARAGNARGSGAASPSRSTAVDGAPEPLPKSPAQRDAEMRAEGERFRGALATAFASQTAAKANDPVPERVNAAFADPSVLEAQAVPVSEDVTCRAAMCLVRARFAPGADSGDWLNRMLLAMGGALPNSSVVAQPQPDGSTEVLIYASRPGDRPPVAWTEAPTR